MYINGVEVDKPTWSRYWKSVQVGISTRYNLEYRFFVHIPFRYKRPERIHQGRVTIGLEDEPGAPRGVNVSDVLGLSDKEQADIQRNVLAQTKLQLMNMMEERFTYCLHCGDTPWLANPWNKRQCAVCMKQKGMGIASTPNIQLQNFLKGLV